VLREGEQAGQGVGYMPDGTMIVLEDGEEFIGKQVEAVVTSSLQTSAGRLIFARIGAEAPRREVAVTSAPAAPLARTIDVATVEVAKPDATASEQAEVSSTGTTSAAPDAPATPQARSPHPPRPPASIRQGTPRNPRR
jgi:hypothetical protein